MGAHPVMGFLAVLAASASAIAPAHGQVSSCSSGMLPIPDGRLQRSVDELKVKNPDLTFQAEDPCGQAKATTRALRRTLHRDYLKRAAGYEFVKVLRGDWYFTIERFRIPNPADRRGLVAALRRCGPHCKLAIEENTCLRHFVAGDDAVFMVSAAAACRGSAEKFLQVKDYFLSLDGAASPSNSGAADAAAPESRP